MASWRDSASTAAQGDLDRLLNAVVPYAKDNLVADGVMLPFGAGLDVAGEMAMLAVTPGARIPAGADAVLELLYADAQQEAGLNRAFAFVADVRPAGDPAIGIQLEHREGVALAVQLSYTRSWLRRRVVLGPMVVRPGPRRVWTAS